MAESKSAPDALEVLRKTMDGIARQIGAMEPDDLRRKILVNELSKLTRLRIWLRSETNKVFVEKADELMRELARRKIDDHESDRSIGQNSALNAFVERTIALARIGV